MKYHVLLAGIVIGMWACSIGLSWIAISYCNAHPLADCR